MKLPTQEQCFAYFEQYKVPGNIKAHCLAVQKVALFLARELNAVGFSFDLEQVRALSLLHDIFKAVVIKELKPNRFHSYQATQEEIAMHKVLREKYNGMLEGDVAYELFNEEFPQMALSLKRLSNPAIEDRTEMEFFVHYVDWRVLRDVVVTLPERIAYLEEVYPSAVQRKEWEPDVEEIHQYEQTIFSQLSFKPEDLKQKVEQEQ